MIGFPLWGEIPRGIKKGAERHFFCLSGAFWGVLGRFWWQVACCLFLPLLGRFCLFLRLFGPRGEACCPPVWESSRRGGMLLLVMFLAYDMVAGGMRRHEVGAALLALRLVAVAAASTECFCLGMFLLAYDVVRRAACRHVGNLLGVAECCFSGVSASLFLLFWP